MEVIKDIDLLQTRLIAALRKRVQNGEVTERGFARRTGISQSHVNRVLKGTRTLSIDNFQHILNSLNYSVLDLYSETELRCQLKKLAPNSRHPVELPFLESSIGPRHAWRDSFCWNDRRVVPCLPVPTLRHAILVRLVYDPEMEFSLKGYNVAVLNASDCFETTDLEALYAVDRGHDTVLRRIRKASNCFYLIPDVRRSEPIHWEKVGISTERRVIIRGKLVWLGKEEELAGSQTARNYLREAATSS
jgi:transcriptional regulator with XRE-family HTH domain